VQDESSGNLNLGYLLFEVRVWAFIFDLRLVRWGPEELCVAWDASTSEQSQNRSKRADSRSACVSNERRDTKEKDFSNARRRENLSVGDDRRDSLKELKGIRLIADLLYRHCFSSWHGLRGELWKAAPPLV
jgi:hypothetical protein